MRHFVDFGKVLQVLTKRGVAVDHQARKEAREHFEARFQETVEKTQAIAPKAVRPVEPKRGYKKSEEQLRAGGQWVEGEMVQRPVELTPEDLARREKERERAKKRLEKEKEKQ